MRLNPEQLASVVKRLDIEALAEKVEEQLAFEMSDASYDRLSTALNDAVAEALVGLDFTP